MTAMSNHDFDVRLAHIDEQYAARREGAEAYRDQELARLFNECGWTQERIAKRVGKKKSWVSYRLRFGAFLDFSTLVEKLESARIQTLTEGAFRRIWAKTAGPEKERFAQVAEILRGGVPAGYRNQLVKPGYRPAIIEILSDGQWHKRSEVMADLEERFGDVAAATFANAVQSLAKAPPKGRRLETRRNLRRFSYRLVERDEDPARDALRRLYDEAKPLIERVKYWGRQHPAEMSPQSILQVGVMLERLFAAALELEDAVSG
jgi:transcriptional regulator with XRE-family HTH domain